MKTTLSAASIVAVLTAAAVLGAAPAQDGGAAPSDAETPRTVPMVRLTLDNGQKITGMLQKEDEATLYVTSLGGGTIGYRRDLIKELSRFTLPTGEYAEQAGDFLAEQLWKVEDASAAYVSARQQYRQALSQTTTARDHQRLLGKLDALEKEREAWQAEMLRRAEAEKAQQESELIRLQKELAEQKLATLRDHEGRLQQVELLTRQFQIALRQLQDQTDRIGRAVEEIDRDLAIVEDDVEDLERLDRIFVTNTVFVDLRRRHEELRREVQRLQRSLGTP